MSVLGFSLLYLVYLSYGAEFLVMDYQKEIENIQKRNSKVELDKTWETSWVRCGCVAVITYIVALFMMIIIGTERPLLAAFVPVMGYLLSTLALKHVRVRWERSNSTR
jgi:uncharacterized membrane protein